MTQEETKKQTAIVPREPGGAMMPREVLQLGEVLASSGYFTDAKDAAQAVVKVLAGQELGFGPISSMTGIYIVRGRVTLSANLIAAAIARSERYSYRIGELTNERCEIVFANANGEIIGLSDFTLDDAKRAGLFKADSAWNTHPRNMLFARALTNGAKWFCPDVMNGSLSIQTMDDVGLPEPVEAANGGADDKTEDSPPALPERVNAPPEGFQPNWSGFWGEMRHLLGDDYRAKAHDFFGVSADNGALKEYAEARAAEHDKTLPQVIAEMRDEVGNSPVEGNNGA